MKSMTGYGRSTVSEGGIELTAEVKSVNNRFLDLSVKSPRIFLAQEEKIRSTVRRYITRGHVDVFLAYTDKREKEKAFSVDTGIARAYRAAAQALEEALPGVVDDASLTFYLRLPDVVRAEESGEADEALIAVLDKALEGALVSLTQMREKEGERLKGDLLVRMETIERLTEAIRVRARRGGRLSQKAHRAHRGISCGEGGRDAYPDGGGGICRQVQHRRRTHAAFFAHQGIPRHLRSSRGG